ncbi:MAG: protein mraZ [Bacteroidales bacterium]|nr:protein mraZ [Bacteroidales bacterium]
MTNFIGDHICKIDAKGRIMLPAALKKQMSSTGADRFVIKKDIFAKCLILYPMEEWERQNRIIRAKVNPYKKEHNQFLRAFYKGTADVNLDGNNRLLIPRRLLDIIGVSNKEVVLAGQYHRIEIWPKDAYERIDGTDDEFAALAEKVLGNINLENSE